MHETRTGNENLQANVEFALSTTNASSYGNVHKSNSNVLHRPQINSGKGYVNESHFQLSNHGYINLLYYTITYLWKVIHLVIEIEENTINNNKNLLIDCRRISVEIYIEKNITTKWSITEINEHAWMKWISTKKIELKNSDRVINTLNQSPIIET